MNTPVGFFLVIISGLCWSAVYVNCVCTGFKQKTCCMPLFALGLNIAWEGIYAVVELFLRDSVSVQAYANAAWFLLDILIVVTWLKFGRENIRSTYAKKWFVPWTVIVLISCVLVQLLFVAVFGDVEAEKYAAYLQNLAMSISFLYLLGRRGNSKGQTMTIAVCKWIGTIAPTIIGGIEHNLFIVGIGGLCFVFDGLYVLFLYHVKQREKGAVRT